MTRTHLKFIRAYVDGYDFSEYASSVGEIGATYPPAECVALTDACKNYLLGGPEIACGPINGYLAPSATTGWHEHMSAITTGAHNVMVAIGVLAVPAAGNPVFAFPMSQMDYKMTAATDEVVAANVSFGGADYSLLPTGFATCWGYLLHAKGAETAVNSAVGIDDPFAFGASTTDGGTFHYQIFSSNGTVTVECQHATANSDGSFADLTGATSGSVDASSTPKSGSVATAATATVHRYLRWQIVFGTANTVTFACSFNRRTK